MQAVRREWTWTGEMVFRSWGQNDWLRSGGSGKCSAASQANVGAAAALSTSIRTKSVGRRALVATLSALVLAAKPGLVMAMDGTAQRADGLDIYFAAIPAAFVRSHPAEHTGRAMPGGAPRDQYTHHLMVALFDSATGQRITDAKVVAFVQGGRESSAIRIKLGPMTIAGAPAYGGFATLAPRDRYRIGIELVRRGGAVVRTVFSHQHLQPQP